MKKLSILILLFSVNSYLSANEPTERDVYCAILQQMESLTLTKTYIEKLKKELINQKNKLVELKQQTLSDNEATDELNGMETITNLKLFSSLLSTMILKELPSDQIKELIDRTSTLPLSESIINNIDTNIEKLTQTIALISSPKYAEFINNQKKTLQELHNYCIRSMTSTNNKANTSPKTPDKTDTLKDQFKKFDLPMPTLKVPNQK